VGSGPGGTPWGLPLDFNQMTARLSHFWAKGRRLSHFSQLPVSEHFGDDSIIRKGEQEWGQHPNWGISLKRLT